MVHFSHCYQSMAGLALVLTYVLHTSRQTQVLTLQTLRQSLRSQLLTTVYRCLCRFDTVHPCGKSMLTLTKKENGPKKPLHFTPVEVTTGFTTPQARRPAVRSSTLGPQLVCSPPDRCPPLTQLGRIRDQLPINELQDAHVWHPSQHASTESDPEASKASRYQQDRAPTPTLAETDRRFCAP